MWSSSAWDAIVGNSFNTLSDFTVFIFNCLNINENMYTFTTEFKLSLWEKLFLSVARIFYANIEKPWISMMDGSYGLCRNR